MAPTNLKAGLTQEKGLGVGGWVGALARRPDLWGEAIGAAWSLRRARWWRRPPFLPLADQALIGWRLATAYGRGDADLHGDDLVAFLTWRRRQWRMR